MANVLNFNNLKKRYLTVTLPDDNHTTLMIGTPTKSIMDELILMQEGISTIGDDRTGSDTINDLYNACAKVMSRNKCGVKITGEYLAELLDVEDIMLFFKSYMDFMSELSNSKN